MAVTIAVARAARLVPDWRFLIFGQDGGRFAELEGLFRSGGGEKMHRARDDPGPTGLVARAQSCAGVTVEDTQRTARCPP